MHRPHLRLDLLVEVDSLLCAVVRLALRRRRGPRGVIRLRRRRRARRRAARAHRIRPSHAPIGALTDIDYDAYRDIRFRPAHALWRDSGLPFEVMFFHAGKTFTHPVRIHEIEGGKVRPISRAARCLRLRPQRGASPLPAAPPSLPASACISRSTARNTRMKSSSSSAQATSAPSVPVSSTGCRHAGSASTPSAPASGGGISGLRVVLDRAPGARRARSWSIYALLNGPRVTGAYRFVMRPGAATAVDVQARLFLRKPVATLGIAPLTSMFFAGENQPRGRRLPPRGARLRRPAGRDRRTASGCGGR